MTVKRYGMISVLGKRAFEYDILALPEGEPRPTTLHEQDAMAAFSRKWIDATDYDALQAERDAFRDNMTDVMNKWAECEAERDALKSALQLAKPAIEAGAVALVNAAFQRVTNQDYAPRCERHAQQLRALAELVK